MTLSPDNPLGLTWPPRSRVMCGPLGEVIGVEFYVPALADAAGKWSILPAPQGSKKPFRTNPKDPAKRPRIILAESSKALKPWREHVAAVARDVWGDHEPLEGPLTLCLTFVLKRPSGTPKTRATPPAIKYPDGSKLQRAVEDSLTGIVWRDDSQVTNWAGLKRLAEIDETPGVLIRVEPDEL